MIDKHSLPPLSVFYADKAHNRGWSHHPICCKLIYLNCAYWTYFIWHTIFYILCILCIFCIFIESLLRNSVEYSWRCAIQDWRRQALCCVKHNGRRRALCCVKECRANALVNHIFFIFLILNIFCIFYYYFAYFAYCRIRSLDFCTNTTILMIYNRTCRHLRWTGGILTCMASSNLIRWINYLNMWNMYTVQYTK